MLISAKGTYALRVLVDMAKHGGQKQYLCILDISKRLDISRKYLETIMTLLAKNNLVESKRGVCGGYKLIKNPSEYNLLEILEITEEDLCPIACLGQNSSCKDHNTCPTVNTFKELQDIISDYLRNKTLLDLMDPNDNC